MQINPNVRSNPEGREKEKGKGKGKGNFPGSAPWHPAVPGLPGAWISQCPHTPAPRRWLRQSLHPRDWRHVWDPLLHSSPKKQEPGVCTLNPALAVSAALGSSPWILLAPPRQGRAQVSVPLHSQGLESHAVPPPQPSPGRALPPAAALNKPLSVLLITLGCSSGLAGAGGGCADSARDLEGPSAP